MNENKRYWLRGGSLGLIIIAVLSVLAFLKEGYAYAIPIDFRFLIFRSLCNQGLGCLIFGPLEWLVIGFIIGAIIGQLYKKFK